MYKKLLLSVYLGIACSSVNAAEPIQLMLIQSINEGDTLERVELKYGNPIKIRLNTRTYKLNIQNPLTKNNTECFVKVNYTNDRVNKNLVLDSQKWQSQECMSLMELSGYKQYANSSIYNIGDAETTIFFEYQDDKYSRSLNNAKIYDFITDVKSRNISSISLVSYDLPKETKGKAINVKRAMSLKEILENQGVKSNIVYQVEQAQQDDCGNDIGCVIQPWIIKLKVNE